MNIPPDQLNVALRMVKQGDMQPEEAAKWLLQKVSPPDRSDQGPTTVAQLMKRLGPPPIPIQQDWDRQVEALASQYFQTYSVPLTALLADELLVDAHNRLSLSSDAIATRVNSIPRSNLPTLHREPIDSQDNVPRAIVTAEPKPPKPNETTSTSRLAARHRWLAPSVIGTASVMILAATIYVFLPKDDLNEVNSGSESPSPILSASSSSSIFSPTTIESSPPSDLPPKTSATDEASHSSLLSTSEIPADDPPPEKVDRAMLGLDSFAGGNWNTGEDLLPDAGFNPTTIETDDSFTEESSGKGEASDVTEPADDSMPSSDDDEAQDSPTQLISDSTSVVLPVIPPRRDDDEAFPMVDLIDVSPVDMRLSFPSEVGLHLTKSEQGWTVDDVKEQVPVASLYIAEGQLRFGWMQAASSLAIAKQLSSGMLQCDLGDGASRSIFLRSTVTAAPWPLDFTTGDAKAAWPIGLSPPYGPSKFEVTFDLPKTVRHLWIEPPAPEKIRRCQSIAEFSLESDSTVAIRCRIDLRAGSRVTVHARYAAQLDKDFPWQMISIGRVQAAMSQINDQLARTLNEQNQLKLIYSKSSTAEKRLLAVQRDRLELVVSRLQALSKRLISYDSLLNQLQHGSYIRVNLQVQWPGSIESSSQTVFEMQPIEQPAAPEDAGQANEVASEAKGREK